jgi:predicted nucleic acid-binding protein
MILLDTNIISEFMRPSPQPQVMQWLHQQTLTDLFISSVAITEVMYGLNRLPEGKRKQNLLLQFQQLLNQAFTQRILNFGYDEAMVAAQLRRLRAEQGNELHFADAQIAAIAHVRSFSVATRNIKDFLDCGVKLINPFEY